MYCINPATALPFTMQKKFYGLDHLRAFAIFYVFIFHYLMLSRGEPHWLSSFGTFGWTGVDLFFVLSGFLISSQLFKEIKKDRLISFKQFFLKRFFRIIPAYLVTVTIYFCVPFFREYGQLPPLWKFLTFTQNLGLDLNRNSTFSHAWSLCVEEHFYLLLPLILLLLQYTKQIGKTWWLLPVVLVVGIAIRLYSYNKFYLPQAEEEYGGVTWYKYIYYPTYCRLDGLLAGVCIAAVYCFLPTIWNKITVYANILFVTGLCILTGAYFLCSDHQTLAASVFGFTIVAIGFGCILVAALSEKSFLYKIKSRTTTLLANLSYGIYLTHKGIIHITRSLLSDVQINSVLILLICMITCIVAAYILHLVVEKPFMKLRNKIIAPRKI